MHAAPKIDPLTKGYVSLIWSIDDGKVDVEKGATVGNFGRRVPVEEMHESTFKKIVLLMTRAKRSRDDANKLRLDVFDNANDIL